MRVKQIRATYARLMDQSWGIRVTGATADDLKPGWVISVRKKDGTERDETIKAIVSSIAGVFTCSVEPSKAVPSSPKEKAIQQQEHANYREDF